MREDPGLNKHARGWEDGSVCKTFAAKTSGQSLESNQSCNKKTEREKSQGCSSTHLYSQQWRDRNREPIELVGQPT